MLPTRVELKNFTSFQEEHLELDGLRLAALVGANGAGKSSLIDALLFALFGEATKGGSKALDNYVRRGEMEASVAVEFVLHGQAYRVERTRSRAKQKTALRLLKRKGETWQDVGGKSVIEAQAAIEKLLRMDYRTFTASSLILQGKADSLTADMTDTERKDVLTRILGLDLWDRLLEAAKERARDARAKATAVGSRILTLEAEAGKRAGIEADMAAREAELSSAATLVTNLETEVADLRARTQQKAVLEQQIRAIESEIARQQREEQEAAQEAARAEAGLTQQQQILARREEILTAAEAAEAIAEDVRDMDARAERVMAIGRQIEGVGADLARAERELESQRARLTAVIEGAQKQAGLLRDVPCSGTDLQDACRLLAGARQAVVEAEGARTRLQALESDARPAGLRQKRDRLVAEREGIGYDREAHQAARAALDEAQGVARLKPQLEAATERVKELTDRAKIARDKAARAGQEVAQLRTRYQEAQQSLQALAATSSALSLKTSQLASLRANEAHVRETLGRLKQALEAAEGGAAEAERLRTEMQAAQDQAQIWELLTEACSKRGGVPALIVENAVPEIERLANGLLTRVAGGRLQVRLETQAETKAGTMSEVLRITVLDGGQERPYQTYSGAERFMVDLSLRVALSKFLAHRAGAEIQLLVLDEGLGALDSVNRHEVVEAIQEAARDFGRVLCITHITELQDAFPQRIEVTKGSDGSKVRIA